MGWGGGDGEWQGLVKPLLPGANLINFYTCKSQTGPLILNVNTRKDTKKSSKTNSIIPIKDSKQCLLRSLSTCVCKKL